MNSLLRVGFCVSGEGRLFQAAVLNAAALGLYPALAVLEHKASPRLEAFCECHQVPVVRLPRVRRPELDDAIASACIRPDLDLLSLTFDKILPASVIRRYPDRVVNVHPALLPAFAGMDGLGQAERAGVRFAGATIHLADELVDHGPIIAQCLVGLRRDESAAGAGDRIFPLLRPLYLQVLAWFAEGRIEKDAEGRIWVAGATYGELPSSPSVEREFRA